MKVQLKPWANNRQLLFFIGVMIAYPELILARRIFFFLLSDCILLTPSISIRKGFCGVSRPHDHTHKGFCLFLFFFFLSIWLNLAAFEIDMEKVSLSCFQRRYHICISKLGSFSDGFFALARHTRPVQQEEIA